MPEITTITSESLQAEVRRLLPSQRGFGNDLEAQNVIVPIVDLTPTAEGSSLREDLQTAASHDAITNVFRNSAGTSTVITTTGFYKYNATLSVLSSGTAAGNQAEVQLKQGASSRVLHIMRNNSDGNPEEPNTVVVSGVVFIKTGQNLSIRTVGSDATCDISAWQIADVNGNLINPPGFSFE